MTYKAPLQEQVFVLETIGELDSLGSLAAFAGLDLGTATGVLGETSKIVEDRFHSLNQSGDREGAVFANGNITLPTGFGDAYEAWISGGWNGIEAPVEFGGQALPLTLSAAIQEQMFAANLSLSQIMSLTAGAVRAIAAHASDELKATYLPKLISGEWTGTMNLTESHAGSDVGALRTSAVQAEDGSYRIKGSKIFITNGEHDVTENIIHLVLARITGAPEGSKGISLFLVPKFLPDQHGRLSKRNDVVCTSIEHKLGIRASPTCSLSYGDSDGCIGYLVGEEQGGLRAMFTMMNHARIGVGLQGVAVADAAFQRAARYAAERVQSAPIEGGTKPVRIIEHPDVRRNLMTMRCMVEAARALAIYTSLMIDRAHGADGNEADVAVALSELLTPCVKAFCTDVGVEVSSLAIQVFGGTGFIEETGVAQHYRDARILPIYEGTNGIQALDLVRRKLRKDGGKAWKVLHAEVAASAVEWQAKTELKDLGQAIGNAATLLKRQTDRILSSNLTDAAAGATPYLRMFSLVICGWLLGRQADEATGRVQEGAESAFLQAKVASARFFMQQILSQVFSLEHQVSGGADLLFAIGEDQLVA